MWNSRRPRVRIPYPPDAPRRAPFRRVRWSACEAPSGCSRRTSHGLMCSIALAVSGFDSELRLILNASETLGWPYGAIIRLLILTGQRRGEVVGMKWGELDFEKKLCSLPASRTKNKRPHALPLSSAAIDVFASLPRIENAAGLVVPARASRGGNAAPVSAHSKAKVRRDHAIAELAEAEGFGAVRSMGVSRFAPFLRLGDGAARRRLAPDRALLEPLQRKFRRDRFRLSETQIRGWHASRNGRVVGSCRADREWRAGGQRRRTGEGAWRMTQAAEPESDQRHSFESKIAALEETFRGLPIKRAATPDTVNTSELYISVVVRRLLVMGRGSRPRLSAKEEKRLRNMPSVVATESLSQTDLEMLSRRPRPLPTKKGLMDLERSIGHTLEALANLTQPALDGLKETMPDPFLY